MCAHVHTHMLKCHIFGVMERQRAGFLHSKGLIYIDSVKSNLCWILFLLQPICCPTNDKFRGQNRGKVQWAHTPSRNILQTIQYSLQTTHLPAPRVEGAQHDGPRTYKPGVAFQLEPQQAVQPWALYLKVSEPICSLPEWRHSEGLNPKLLSKQANVCEVFLDAQQPLVPK